MSLLNSLIIFSGISFLIYGALCIATDSMKAEFLRFGLEHFRILTGLLELLGGAGLLIGFWWPPAQLMASAGLSVLMLLGVGVRIKVRDGWLETSPAFLLMLVNFYIFANLMEKG